MAEFQVVMKQIQRFCKAQKNCESCPVWNSEYMCCKVENAFKDGELSEALPEIERIVMYWAKEHPEQKYPTWKEWQDATFPEVKSKLCPSMFGGGCVGHCKDCLNRSISAEIAAKLGIKPIGVSSDA